MGHSETLHQHTSHILKSVMWSSSTQWLSFVPQSQIYSTANHNNIMNLIDSWSVLGIDIFDSYCLKQIILALFMVFSDEDLIFQGSIVIEATLPTLSVSLIPYIRINDSTISIILKPIAVLRIVLLPLLAVESAMQWYFMALTPPMQRFVIHSQLTTSMIA